MMITNDQMKSCWEALFLLYQTHSTIW